MSIFRLAIKEIKHGKLNFLFAFLSIVIAVGSFTSVRTLLRTYDCQTEKLLSKRQAELDNRVTKINNDVRSAMLKLGFNITILPKDQNLGDWYAEDYGSKFFPSEYVDKLAQSELKTIEHVVPCLRQRIKWTETKWRVLLIGLGEKITNPSIHTDEISFESVPSGKIILGHEIHNSLGFKVDDQISVLDRQFTVHKCCAERGNKNDVALWLNLRDAQDLLNKKDLINEIRALETQSAWSDIAKIRKEITNILPDTQVIEKTDLVTSNTQLRTETFEKGKALIKGEIKNRENLKDTRTRLAWIIVPLLLLICTGYLSLLSFRNIQDRRGEIGILMSLGYSSNQVQLLFLFRSFILSVMGGVTGFLCAGFFGALNCGLFGSALLISTGITLLATWWPAMSAARQDPADILRYD